MSKSFSLPHYTLMPEIIPRLRTLFTSGFGITAYLIAVLFRAAGLLPVTHPYLQPENFGRYGLRHVLAVGANNLVFKRENIDQIALYGGIVTGLGLIAFQIVLFIIAAIAQEPALAQLVPPADVVTVGSQYNSGADQDIVFMLMDRIFGTQGIFNSCISQVGVACNDIRGNPMPGTDGAYPYPFHTALHAAFQFYSSAMFIIGFMILGYYVVALVSETAVYGTPFGKRVNKVWFPVRMILFFALLAPLNLNGGQNEGLNLAQLITLRAAKIGSNVATNGWNRFLSVLDDPEARTDEFEQPIASSLANRNPALNDKLVATPGTPELGGLIQFIMTAKTCKLAEEITYKDPNNASLHDIQPYLVRSPQALPIVDNPDNVLPLNGTSFDTAREFVKYGNIIVRFGIKSDEGDANFEDFKQYRGHTSPTCGDLVLPVSTTDAGDNTVVRADVSGASQMQEFFYTRIEDLWNDPSLNRWSECIVDRVIQIGQKNPCGRNDLPTSASLREFTQNYEKDLKDELEEFVKQQEAVIIKGITPPLRAKGWGAAGIWYNRIAQMNGEMVTSVFNVPTPKEYPTGMREIQEQQTAQSDNIGPEQMFSTTLPDGEAITSARGEKGVKIAIAESKAHYLWMGNDSTASNSTQNTGNIFIDAINLIFGTSGIFDMRKNADVHPLGQLSSLGRGMIEATVRNIGIGSGIRGAGLLFGGLPKELGGIVGGFLYSMGMLTLGMSFILFYVLPFMPFIYFFFAVANWAKTIFEAIVAMPLWALSHIAQLEGEGIMGPAALNGYMLIFEIVVRPILIVVGLIASIVIFSSLVVVLNDIFNLAVQNVSGSGVIDPTDPASMAAAKLDKSPIDEFFFTVLYTIIVYIIGLSSFKLIDQIPQNILRWIGQDVKTFQGVETSAVDGVLQRSYAGANLLTGNFQGGLLAGLV